ncbi:RteC domain-containing protein [Epilithonimonas sp.]
MALKWTAPKVSLIELMYALHSEGGIKLRNS